MKILRKRIFHFSICIPQVSVGQSFRDKNLFVADADRTKTTTKTDYFGGGQKVEIHVHYFRGFSPVDYRKLLIFARARLGM